MYVKEEKESSFRKFFNLEERLFIVRVFRIIIVILSLFEPQPGRVWWKEPRQSTQWDIIEGLVWHTSPEMTLQENGARYDRELTKKCPN